MTALDSMAIALLLQIAGPHRHIRPADTIPAEFTVRVADYVEARRRVAPGFEDPAFCADDEEASRQTAALAAAIRAAKPLAEGDVFTPRSASAFRDLIAIGVRDGLERIAVTLSDDAIELEVYAAIPWGAERAVSPALVDTLPALPLELAYRFVGRHLVLVDPGANLVVDIVRDALPLSRTTNSNACDVHPELPRCWM